MYLFETSVADPGCLSRIWIFSIPNPWSEFFQSRFRNKELKCKCPGNKKSILTQKIVSKLSEIWSGLFIRDPFPDFYSFLIPDPGVKKVPDPGSASLSLTVVCFLQGEARAEPEYDGQAGRHDAEGWWGSSSTPHSGTAFLQLGTIHNYCIRTQPASLMCVKQGCSSE